MKRVLGLVCSLAAMMFGTAAISVSYVGWWIALRPSYQFALLWLAVMLLLILVCISFALLLASRRD